MIGSFCRFMIASVRKMCYNYISYNFLMMCRPETEADKYV